VQKVFVILLICTPKAFANFQPSGWSAATTLGTKNYKNPTTLKGLGMCENNPSGFKIVLIELIPGLSLRSNHWAEISQRLRRMFHRQSAFCG